MNKTDKIYIAGHGGLVGSALMRTLQQQGYSNLLTRTHAQLDLTDQAAVGAFFSQEKPDYVFLAAAKVGGIHANSTYPAEFIYSNLAISTHVTHASWQQGVKRMLFLGSSCIYPRMAPQPLKEEYLLTGELEPTNRPYALAKIAGMEMCGSYNRQYGTQFLVAMPTNLYGYGDNYHPENSHVIPALIRKFVEAKQSGTSSVTVWGTGTPKREFMYSDDLANACVFLMNLPDARFTSLIEGSSPLINVGVGEDVTIAELAQLIQQLVGYTGEVVFDASKPDGTPRKCLDVGRLHALGWKASTPLKTGLANAIADFVKHTV